MLRLEIDQDWLLKNYIVVLKNEQVWISSIFCPFYQQFFGWLYCISELSTVYHRESPRLLGTNGGSLMKYTHDKMIADRNGHGVQWQNILLHCWSSTFCRICGTTLTHNRCISTWPSNCLLLDPYSYLSIFINIWFAIRRLNKYMLYGKGFLKAHTQATQSEMKCTNEKMTWNTQDTTSLDMCPRLMWITP